MLVRTRMKNMIDEDVLREEREAEKVLWNYY